MSVYHGDDVVLKVSHYGGLYRLHESVVHDVTKGQRSVCSGCANAVRKSYGLGGGFKPLTTQRVVPVRVSSTDIYGLIIDIDNQVWLDH